MNPPLGQKITMPVHPQILSKHVEGGNRIPQGFIFGVKVKTTHLNTSKPKSNVTGEVRGYGLNKVPLETINKCLFFWTTKIGGETVRYNFKHFPDKLDLKMDCKFVNRA